MALGEQAVTSNGTTSYYYAQDHLGSVRDLVTASGQVLASYDYDPYGNPTRTTQSGSARADYRYAGLFYHTQSGLYLTHYRVYDPVTARWLSRDPIGETGGINLYGYVGGNPVQYTDPEGLKSIVAPGPKDPSRPPTKTEKQLANPKICTNKPYAECLVCCGKIEGQLATAGTIGSACAEQCARKEGITMIIPYSNQCSL